MDFVARESGRSDRPRRKPIATHAKQNSMATLTAGAVAAMTPPQVIERAHAALLKVYRDLRLQSGGVGQTKLEEDLEEVLVLLASATEDNASHAGFCPVSGSVIGGKLSKMMEATVSSILAESEGSFVVKKNFLQELGRMKVALAGKMPVETGTAGKHLYGSAQSHRYEGSRRRSQRG